MNVVDEWMDEKRMNFTDEQTNLEYSKNDISDEQRNYVQTFEKKTNQINKRYYFDKK